MKLKKLLVSMIFCGLLLCVINVNAATEIASGSCGENVNWILDSDGTLTINGTGAMNDGDNYMPWYSNRNNIKKVIVSDGVTAIGARAFYSCENLTDVSIPNSVIDIRDRAFYDCDGLVNINLPKGIKKISNQLFYSCGNLQSIIIPDGVESIGNSAFMDCSSLTSITIPDRDCDKIGLNQ